MKEETRKKSDNLRNRLIYGFSGFFLMLGGMVWNQWTYFFVFNVISLVCLNEYFRMFIEYGKRPLRWYGLILGQCIYTFSFLISDGLISNSVYLFLYPLFSLAFIIKLYDVEEKASFEQIGITLLGLIYVMLPFASLHLAVFWDGQFHYQVILGIFFIVWIHDIGAYFIGSRYGRRQLFSRISPNKSWEGTFGGAVLAWMMAFLLAQYLHDLNLVQWLVIATIIIVFGTHGDLVESMLKRNISLKDSSEMLPGHGGFLDRFDNLLISAPFIALFLKIF